MRVLKVGFRNERHPRRLRRPAMSTRLEEIAAAGFPFRKASRDQFLLEGVSVLTSLAAALKWPRSSFDIRQIPGGAGHPPMVVLHGEHLYLQLTARGSPVAKPSVVVRPCKGRQDFGGPRYDRLAVSTLYDPRLFVATLRSLGLGGTVAIRKAIQKAPGDGPKER